MLGIGSVVAPVIPKVLSDMAQSQDKVQTQDAFAPSVTVTNNSSPYYIYADYDKRIIRSPGFASFQIQEYYQDGG